MRRTLRPALILALLAGSAGALENVRLDLIAKDFAPLDAPVLITGTGRVVHMHWQAEEKRPGTVYAVFAVPPRTWSEIAFSCTPRQDCSATLTLSGPWKPKAGGDGKEVELLPVLYDDLTAEGATLVNGGFEELDAATGVPVGWVKVLGAQRVVDTGAHSGERAAEVSVKGGYSQQLRLRAGTPLTIRLWAWSETDPAAK